MRFIKTVSLLATVIAVSAAGAQVPAADPSAKLREVLPADIAERVLAKIAEARARELPAQALENRALKFAARGVPASEIEKSVNAQADRMQRSRDAIEKGRGAKANGGEIDAGAEAMRKGVDGAKVSELAQSAPSGRSLEVPLFVIGSLVERGLPSDAALARVKEKLEVRATDRELESLPGDVARGKPATTGQDLAATKRPANPGGNRATPPNVPRNPGKATPPVITPKPPTKRP